MSIILYSIILKNCMKKKKVEVNLTKTPTMTSSHSCFTPIYVFLFYTEGGESKGDVPAGNRVYKYDFRLIFI